VVLVVILVFFVLIYRSYKEKKRANMIITQQKQEVERQKHIVEMKQKEILDSIRYAKRIQTSLISSERSIEKNLKRLREQP
jgi:hypothetical protein